jgi:hypothetical protein
MKMNNGNIIPHIEAEQTRKSAQRARYTAYLQCIRKLELKAMADSERKNKASEMGGKKEC